MKQTNEKFDSVSTIQFERKIQLGFEPIIMHQFLCLSIALNVYNIHNTLIEIYI